MSMIVSPYANGIPTDSEYYDVALMLLGYSITEDDSFSPKKINSAGTPTVSTATGRSTILFATAGDRLTIPNYGADVGRSLWRAPYSNNVIYNTIETFVSLTGYSSGYSGTFASAIFGTMNTTVTTGYWIGFYGTASAWTGIRVQTRSSGSIVNYDTPCTINLNTRYHIAVTARDATLKIYLDGTQIYSAAAAGSWSGADLTIGALNQTNAYQLFGHIDNFRWTRGQSAFRYTGTFSPPVGDFIKNGPADPVVIQLPATDYNTGTPNGGGNITPAYGYWSGNITAAMQSGGNGSYVQTVTNIIDTGAFVTKFGGCTFPRAEVNIPGTGRHHMMAFPTRVATIEFNMRWSSIPASLIYMFSYGCGLNSTANWTYGWAIRKFATHEINFFFVKKDLTYTTFSTPVSISTTAIAANTNYHVAIVMNATTVKIYLDGVLKATATNSDLIHAVAYANIGDVAAGLSIGTINASGSNFANGEFLWANFRVTLKEVYTAAFTPPANKFALP